MNPGPTMVDSTPVARGGGDGTQAYVLTIPGKTAMEVGGLPAGWYEHPEAASALTVRDIQAVYKHLQQHGMSQRGIATLTGQGQSEVCEIVAGRRVQDYDVLKRIAAGLGVPRGLMGLAADTSGLSIVDKADDDQVRVLAMADDTRTKPKLVITSQTRTGEAQQRLSDCRCDGVAAGCVAAGCVAVESGRPAVVLTLPVGFWDDPAVAGALRIRDIAGVFRFLQDRGLSQRVITRYWELVSIWPVKGAGRGRSSPVLATVCST